ncbi:hypothetical protein ZHAS_00022121 [Anopheles sinensis]|uniref:Uncharacterized protein n=1 Tax=Anopheles sinensis TaxID=74873 RepID=A0A084WTY6_ANOSI|nr:hypothetical protein ZHAS_00022121 [Anopheles sinensis]
MLACSFGFVESANGDTPDGSLTPPPTARNDDSLDLITLDTTNNSSFELEDFDPLNERAKPIGPKGGGVPHDTSSSALTTSSYSSSGLAIATGSHGVTVPSVSFPSNSLGVNNPVYPYFTPLYQQNVSPHHHHQHASSHQPHQPSARQGAAIGPAAAGAGTGAGPRASNTSDDFELLRNYGLDKFSLLDGGSTARSNSALHMNGGSTAHGKGIQHHHTRSFNLPNHQQGSAGLNGGTGGSCGSSRLAMSTSHTAAGNSSSSSGSGGTELLENAAIGRSSAGSRPSFSNWTTFD